MSEGSHKGIAFRLGKSLLLQYPSLNYECLHCGQSCTSFDVKANALEARRVKRLGGEHTVQGAGNRFSLAQTPCGSCVFHAPSEEGGCSLHREHGARAKPRWCRDFPFRALTTEVGEFVGASFACTAILRKYGPAVSSHTVSVAPRPLPAVPLARDVPFEAGTYLRWEARVLELMRNVGEAGLEQAAVELSAELGPSPPAERRKPALDILGRGLLSLAEEGWTEGRELEVLMDAHRHGGGFPDRFLGLSVDPALVVARWESPWQAWALVEPFFEHLVFRKYLLEGPDVHSRLCSLPALARLLQFLTLAHSGSRLGPPQEQDLHWALRTLEQRLTFHALGWERFLLHFSNAYLQAW